MVFWEDWVSVNQLHQRRKGTGQGKAVGSTNRDLRRSDLNSVCFVERVNVVVVRRIRNRDGHCGNRRLYLLQVIVVLAVRIFTRIKDLLKELVVVEYVLLALLPAILVCTRHIQACQGGYPRDIGLFRWWGDRNLESNTGEYHHEWGAGTQIFSKPNQIH